MLGGLVSNWAASTGSGPPWGSSAVLSPGSIIRTGIPKQTPPPPAPPECRTEPHRRRNMAGDMPDLRRPSWPHWGWLACFSFHNTAVSTVAGIMAKTEGAMRKDGLAGNIGFGGWKAWTVAVLRWKAWTVAMVRRRG